MRNCVGGTGSVVLQDLTESFRSFRLISGLCWYCLSLYFSWIILSATYVRNTMPDSFRHIVDCSSLFLQHDHLCVASSRVMVVGCGSCIYVSHDVWQCTIYHLVQDAWSWISRASPDFLTRRCVLPTVFQTTFSCINWACRLYNHRKRNVRIVHARYSLKWFLQQDRLGMFAYGSFIRLLEWAVWPEAGFHRRQESSISAYLRWFGHLDFSSGDFFQLDQPCYRHWFFAWMLFYVVDIVAIYGESTAQWNAN